MITLLNVIDFLFLDKTFIFFNLIEKEFNKNYLQCSNLWHFSIYVAQKYQILHQSSALQGVACYVHYFLYSCI